jgi:hypothetical protein
MTLETPRYTEAAERLAGSFHAFCNELPEEERSLMRATLLWPEGRLKHDGDVQGHVIGTLVDYFAWCHYLINDAPPAPGGKKADGTPWRW